jgi:hypothetical protein
MPESWGRKHCHVSAISQVTNRIKLDFNNKHFRNLRYNINAASTLDTISSNRVIIGMVRVNSSVSTELARMRFCEPLKRMQNLLKAHKDCKCESNEIMMQNSLN